MTPAIKEKLLMGECLYYALIQAAKHPQYEIYLVLDTKVSYPSLYHAVLYDGKDYFDAQGHIPNIDTYIQKYYSFDHNYTIIQSADIISVISGLEPNEQKNLDQLWLAVDENSNPISKDYLLNLIETK